MAFYKRLIAVNLQAYTYPWVNVDSFASKTWDLKRLFEFEMSDYIKVRDIYIT